MYVILSIGYQRKTLVYQVRDHSFIINQNGDVIQDEKFIRDFIKDQVSGDILYKDSTIKSGNPEDILKNDEIFGVAIKTEENHKYDFIISLDHCYEDYFKFLEEYLSIDKEHYDKLLASIKTELRDRTLNELI